MEINPTFTPYREPIRDVRLLPVHAPAKLLGRNRELAAIHAEIKAGGSVLISGGAGVGKSALAAVMATAFAPQQGGVVWLNIVEDDTAYLAARVGRAYGVDTYSAPGESWTRRAVIVNELLRKEHPLIILDGIADLGEANAFIEQCAPNVPVIIVNEASDAGSWRVFSLNTLALPEAVAVFRYFAGSNDAQIRADAEPLVNALDGLPLTLELAARALAAERLPSGELLERLASSTFSSTLERVIDFAVKRLNPMLQGVLMVLCATFAGSATVRLLSQISGIPAPNLIAVLRQLAARSLVRESALYNQPMFSAHDAVRRYALNVLRSSGRLDDLENRALAAMVAYSAASEEHKHLALEIDNILGAAAFATAREDSGALDMLLHTLRRIESQGFRPEVDILRQLSTRFEDDDAGVSDSRPMPAVSATDSIDTKAPEAETHSLQATQAVIATQPMQAEPASLEDSDKTPIFKSVFGSTERGPKPNLPYVPVRTDITLDDTTMGDTALFGRTEPLDATDSYLEQALPFVPIRVVDTERLTDEISQSEQSGDSRRLGQLLMQQGNTQWERAEDSAALESFRRALDAFQAAGEYQGQGQILQRMGLLYLELNQPDSASLRLEQAAAAFQRVGNVTEEIHAIGSSGQAYAQLRDWERATDAYQRALFLSRERGDRSAEARYLAAIGEVYYLQKRFSEAVQYYRGALHLAYLVENEPLQSRFAGFLGMVLLDELNSLGMAVQLLEEATKTDPENSAAKRYLKRAQTRLKHVTAAGIGADQPTQTNREYAAGAYI